MNRNCNSKQKWDGKQNMSKYKRERETETYNWVMWQVVLLLDVQSHLINGL